MAKKIASEGPFLTSKQTAYYLGLQERSLERLRRTQSGPRYIRIGRQVRYDVRDVLAFAGLLNNADQKCG